jgi:GntR family transcriptional regulator
VRSLLNGDRNLGRALAETLRARIVAGEFPPGTRLPSETRLAAEYDVSRVTVRTAIKLLESQGFVDVRHGSGTFVNDFGDGIRSGLQELRSITETIREMGFEPGMERHSYAVRPATDHESSRLALDAGADVIAIERAVLADGQAVAFSYDAVPRSALPDVDVADLGQQSVFDAMRQMGKDPARALAEVHAVVSDDVGWGPQRPDPGLYLLLDQVHFDRSGERLMYSRTYFVEGRFQFVILRTR